MSTAAELDTSYLHLKVAVDDACAEMDRLRAVNKEMLEALEELLPYLPDSNDAKNSAAENEGRAAHWHVVALQAREAIRKARGEK